jgi:hypothetical protein
MEIKSHEKAILTKDQNVWANCWNGGPLWVVYTVEQALEILEQIG